MPDGDNEPNFVPIGSSRRVSTYRVARPHAGILHVAAGRFEATEYADPRTGIRGAFLNAKDGIIGTSMSSRRLIEERLSKRVALAIFSSDAISSTAYATQEILLILVLAGTGALTYSLPIATAIVALLFIVVASYRQLIRAYPNGGGAYTVARENLGSFPGLTAGAALLIDYVLTVSVSIAACVEAIASAVPSAHDYAVPLAAGLVLLIAVGNLRGIRESGTLFSIPTYGFVFLLSGTIILGAIKVFLGDEPNIFAAGDPVRDPGAHQALTLFLILRAFSAGCAALTGVEAISNGVSAFKPPEWKNAVITMTAMAGLLAFLFLGTTLLARHYGIVYEHGDRETVMSQVGEEVFGRNFFYFLLQGFTAGILFLAANTAYSGFPLLGAILARDGYLPRLFHQRGNRLVFSYGIAALTISAILLLVAFNATTTRLIPLYALGVFLCFTLAQAGMVKLWFSRRDAGWRRSAIINGFGALVTGIVFIIILVTKFTQGGWMVAVLLPLLIVWLARIGGFYSNLKRRVRVQPGPSIGLRPTGPSRTLHLVPVEDINLPTVMAISAACDRSSNVSAVHIHFDPEDDDNLVARWQDQFPDIPLVVIESPYREVAEPFSWYIVDRLKETGGVTVIVPVVRTRHWWQRPLVNQSLHRLRSALAGRRGVEIIEQPFAVG
ncbi:MAG: APC family permease [Tepidiformaceae bacterium]